MNNKLHVAIMTDEKGWHSDTLKDAFNTFNCHISPVSLADCRIDLSKKHGLDIPGFENDLPTGIFVRGISAGSLEQITLRLGILHALRELGIPVYNDARAIERSVDKSMTSFLLHKAGLSTPSTWVGESVDHARYYLSEEIAKGNEVVIKPLFGSQGMGLKRLAKMDDLPGSIEYNNVYYLQRFINNEHRQWHDWRVFVIGNKAIAAMKRQGQTWISNVAQGATCEFAIVNDELAYLAENAARALGLDYAGIDIIRDNNGQAYVLEVNSMPAWAGLQTVNHLNIAQLLAKDLLLRRLQA